jgi:hypothetical protein
MKNEEDVAVLEFVINELIRVGKHTGNETIFKKARAIVCKLKKQSK